MFGMFFDSNRAKTVLFGGYLAKDFFSDTWEWDSAGWVQRVPSGPKSRDWHAACYDLVRERSVLFGGLYYDAQLGRTNALGDTFEWDGQVWVNRSSTGPSSRYGQALAYDSLRGRVVLFGGRESAGPCGDTWEWDGINWMQRASVGPSPRQGHSMAFDAIRNRVVLFGGTNGFIFGEETYGDTWEWDGISWAQRPAVGPVPRSGHSMSFDSSRHRIVLFGGFDGNSNSYFGDTWEWDGTSWTNRSNPGPPERSNHATAYDSSRRCTVLFGGSKSFGAPPYFEDLWEWDGQRWIKRSLTGPLPRDRHILAFDPIRNAMLLFGGFENATYFGDTWEYRGFNLGDMNGDGNVDGLDIQPFVTAISNGSTDPTDIYLADFDSSGALTTADVDGFVSALLAH
jgi:hypothetical protein